MMSASSTSPSASATKVAIFIPSLGGGGAERMFVRKATRLAACGYKVSLVLMSGADMHYLDELSSSVQIVVLDRPRLWTSAPALRRYLVREKPDVLIASMPLANAIAVLVARTVSPRPLVILTEHNAVSLVFSDNDTPRYWPLVPIVRYSYQLADAVVCVSRGIARRMRDVPGLKSQNVWVIYNPAWYPDMLARAAELPAIDLGEETDDVPIIVAAGRLVAQKDFATLLRAFALVRERRSARLVIVGEGMLRSDLEQLASDLDIRRDVSLPGFVENPWSVFARATVFVLSSAHEGFGNVLVEAMACGTPVVSTDCPSGPSEILEGGRFGPLVPVGDPAALANAIEAMIDNPTPRERLLQRAREFSVEASVEGYIQVLDKIKARRQANIAPTPL